MFPARSIGPACPTCSSSNETLRSEARYSRSRLPPAWPVTRPAAVAVTSNTRSSTVRASESHSLQPLRCRLLDGHGFFSGGELGYPQRLEGSKFRTLDVEGVRLFPDRAGPGSRMTWLQIGLAELAAMPAVAGWTTFSRLYSGWVAGMTDLMLVPNLPGVSMTPRLSAQWQRTQAAYVPTLLAWPIRLQRVWSWSYCSKNPLMGGDGVALGGSSGLRRGALARRTVGT